MAKRIHLRHGKVKALAHDCGVSTETVRRALQYQNDTDTQMLIRKTAKDNGYIQK